MISLLFNPFKFIAGIKSLVLGLVIIAATAYFGFLSHTNFPDLISVKICPPFSLGFFLWQSLSNWLVFSIVLYVGSLIVSRSSIRFIDILGTQALARYPYVFCSLTGFSDSIQQFSNYMLSTYMHKGITVTLTPITMITAVTLLIISILLTIWMVALMYNAFRVSTNLKGTKSVLLFIVSFIVTMILTFVISNYLRTKFT